MLQKISISNKSCSFELVKKMYLRLIKHPIIILKDHVTLKTGVMMLKIQLLSQE